MQKTRTVFVMLILCFHYRYIHASSNQLGSCQGQAPFRIGNGSILNSVKFIHIPKTAGSSLLIDFKDHLVGGDEGCYMLYKKTRGDLFYFIFVRSPRAHVFSQYKYARELLPASQLIHNMSIGDRFNLLPRSNLAFPVGQNVTSGFAAWLDHFMRGLQKDGSMTETDSFNYFHPYNYQARVLSRHCSRNTSWEFSPEIQTIMEMRRSTAVMNELSFVGITEFYEASVCLLRFHLQLHMPISCTSPNSIDSTMSHVGKSMSFPRSGIPLALWRKVDALTKYDRMLYCAALHRFACAVENFQNITGLTLSRVGVSVDWLLDISSMCLLKNH